MTVSFLTPKTNKRSKLSDRKSILVVRETVRTHDFMVENVRFIRTNPPQTKVLVFKPYLLTQGCILAPITTRLYIEARIPFALL